MTADNAIDLATLAGHVGLEPPDPRADISIVGVCALTPGRACHIGYAENATHATALRETAASAVILPAGLAALTDKPCLVTDRPRLMFARIAACFIAPGPAPGIHPTAVLGTGVRVADTSSIGPHAVLGDDVVVGANTVIGPGVVIGNGVGIGADTRVAANVSIAADVSIGARVAIEANAAIGGRGFGLVHNGTGWEAVPQMGCVCIGDDVEIGAGSTIDRGALDDTMIGNGVKIDDQVHIGHNCVIGAHTVIAGCTGIAGSCVIGSNCMIGGGVGIGDHVRIVDGVIITGASQVPKDIVAPGVYSSTFRAMPAKGWRKRLALFRKLDRMEHRLRQIERGNDT